MKRYIALLVMLVSMVSCIAMVLTTMPIKLAAPTRMPSGSATTTWTRNSGSDTMSFAIRVTSQTTQGQIYYVATDGDDSNPGTKAQPFRTISRGTSIVQAGDTLYVRAGTYLEQVVVSNSGTENNSITISAYPGENPVIDGQDNIPGKWDFLLKLVGSYIVANGLEVRNSAHGGVYVAGNYNELSSLNVHHNYSSGIIVTGDYNIVDGCRVWWNSKNNEYGADDGWGAGLSAARYPSYTTIRNNLVYNNWGEGLSTFEAEHTSIEDNVVYDNWAVNIYIDNAPYTLVQRNLVYDTGDSNFSRDPGIGFTDEQYDSKPARSHHLIIINNLVFGGSSAFSFWSDHPDSGLKHSLIAHNTFVNGNMWATLTIGPGNHENTRIENNVFLQEDSLPIADVVNDLSLYFSNNLWSKTPPSNVSSSDDVIGDPQLAKSGSIGPGQLTPEWFMFLPSSPALDRAKVISEVTEDFFRNPRGSYPDIGAYEFPFSFRVSDLRVIAAVHDNTSLTVTLRWTAPFDAISYTLRSSDTPLSAANWSETPIVTELIPASPPGTIEWLTSPVDYTGDTLYLALKSQNSVGGWSELSNNAFWPHWDVYMPFVMKNDTREKAVQVAHHGH